MRWLGSAGDGAGRGVCGGLEGKEGGREDEEGEEIVLVMCGRAAEWLAVLCIGGNLKETKRERQTDAYTAAERQTDSEGYGLRWRGEGIEVV